MAFQDFLEAFAEVQGIGNAETLLKEHADRYIFQLRSRERAKELLSKLESALDLDPAGKKVLDIGCAYGSFSIEFANRGAEVVGIDISEKWLKLAEANAKGEADVVFLNRDASSRKALADLKAHAPFDVVILNDVFEHIYDTAGLLGNLVDLMAPGAKIYFKVPNGLATRHVLLEGHKKVFGISLLPPDYWHLYVKAPFHIYYRRWEYFQALFDHFGLRLEESLPPPVRDPNIKTTRRHIQNDLTRMRRLLKRENFKDNVQFVHVRRALAYYFEEVEEDLEHLPFEDLFHKYRITFWEGILSKTGSASVS